MPYSVSNPPAAVKGLPSHAIEIYVAAFNSAFEQYKDEGKAAATAWAAVKTKYKKVDDKWVTKESITEIKCTLCGGDRVEPLSDTEWKCYVCGEVFSTKEVNMHPHGDHVCYCPECKKEITVEVGIKCNTQKCPECGSPMVAKEAGERRESLSAEDKKSLLGAALTDQYKLKVENPIPSGVSVEEVFDDHLIYSIDGQAYKATYELGEDGIKFGEPQKVIAKKVYTAMESLREKHSEIIQEIGKRNAAADASRVRKIMELCQELLSSEAEESAVKKAIKEADNVLKWLREQAVVKTEDGVKFPASAFAYVPDPEKPSSWKLRLWENPTVKETRKQLGAAAAALSPGGFRGQKAQIPSSDLPAVKRKIRAAYRSLDVNDEDIPRWVKEAELRTLLTGFIPLTEAKINGKAIVTVIKPGFNFTKDRYYLPETLSRDFGVFEGVKMYADHPTEDDERNRPERSIKDWVATLNNVHMENDNIVGEAVIVEPWLKEKLALLRDTGMLKEMGVSINAVGTATQGEMEGVKTNIVERFVRARSVDFVTEAGAGGLVEMYEAGRDVDIDFCTLDTLRERRPELVKEIEDTVRNTLLKEVKKQMELEEEIKELKETNETLTKERDDLKAEKEAAEKAKLLAETKATVEDAVSKAELPEPAKARILARYKDADSADGLAEAITAEAEYIAAISEAGKVKDMGGSKPDPEDSKKALAGSFKAAHPEWTDEQIETAVRGR